MKYNEELVQQVRKGRLAIKNDGTLEELRNLLEYCFPEDKSIVSGNFKYYAASVSKKVWLCYTHTNLPHKSVKEFIMKELPKKYCIKIPNYETGLFIINKLALENLRWYERYPSNVNYFCFDNNSYVSWTVSKPETFTEITFDEFKELVLKENMETKKIIGYKCPINLFNNQITRNTLYIKRNNGNVWYIPTETNLDADDFSMPKEIVETWEAVYEEEKPKEKVITVNGTSITIKKGSLSAEGKNFEIGKIKYLVGIMSSNYNKDFWDTEFTEVKIGCKTGWTKANLEEIIKEYEQFNK